MCRNIRTLFNFEPPVTNQEDPRSIVAVRKKDHRLQHAVEGERGPFFSAVDEVARISGQLPASLCASNQKSWRRRRNAEVRIIVSDPQRRKPRKSNPICFLMAAARRRSSSIRRHLAPLGDKKPDDLKLAFSNRMYKCFVFDDGVLIGTGRALADGVDCSYLCDITVHPDFQGHRLSKAITEKFKELSAGPQENHPVRRPCERRMRRQ
jgi:hypothetical protein